MARCKACGAVIAFLRTPAGRLCPYDVDAEGRVTGVSHYKTCSDPGRFTKRAERGPRPAVARDTQGSAGGSGGPARGPASGGVR